MRKQHLLLSVSLLSLILLPRAASAQSGSGIEPPADMQMDERGVDLTTGKLTLDPAAFAIGGQEGGVSYFRPMGIQDYRDEYDSYIAGSTNGLGVVVRIGALADQFNSGIPKSQSGTGATLKTDGYNYTYTTANGTVYQFSHSVYGRVWVNGVFKGDSPKVTSIVEPSGYTRNIEYTVREYNITNLNGTFPVRVSRPSAVTSNDGYRLTFWYAFNDNEDTLDSGTAERWMTVSSVTGSNAADRYCTSSSCGPSTPGVRSARYNRSGSSEIRVDAAGRETHVSLDAQGRVVNILPPGPGATPIQIAYDSDGRVSSYGQGSSVWTYVWGYATDAEGTNRTATVTSSTGLVTVAASRISTGKLVSLRVGSGGTTTFRYDSVSRLTDVIAPEGNRKNYAYDGNDNIVRLTSYGKGGEEISSVSATFPSDCSNVKTCHRPLTITDERGATTVFQYAPEHGQPTLITRPAAGPGQAQRQQALTYQPLYAWFRNASGALTQAASPIWKLVETAECATATQCVGSSQETRTSVSYGAAGQPNNLLPTSVTVRAGDSSVSSTTTTAYTPFGEVQATTVGADDATVYRYDVAGGLEGVISPDPDRGGPRRRQAVRYARDGAGRVVTTELGTVAGPSDADWSGFTQNQVVTAAYDGRGLKTSDVLSVNGAFAGASWYDYDLDGRLRCEIKRYAFQGYTCEQAVSNEGSDSITEYVYGGNGEIATIRQNGIDATRYAYSANGQVVSATDANNNATTYQYDSSDRLLRTTYADGSYEYLNRNAAGDISSVRQRDGRTITNHYDALGRLTAQWLPGDVGGNSNPAFSYDLKDRMISASNANGQSQGTNSSTFSYDALDRPTGETATLAGIGPRTTSYAYDAAGRRTRLGWFDNYFVTYEYDPAGQLTVIRENGGAPLANFGYDDLGRRTTLGRGNGTSTSYGYDGAGRLTSLVQDLGGTVSDLTTQLTRDKLGRITARDLSNDAYVWNGYLPASRSYGRNGLNQYTSAGPVSFGYDGRGNLNYDSSGSSYAFDSSNQLVATSSGAALAYDAQGRLTYTAVNDGNVTRFGYDGDQIISEFDVNGGLVRRYVPGLGDDEILVSYGPEGRRYLYADERGSIIAAADDAGNASQILSYDEFGIPAATNTLRFQYTGQAWLPELGLYHYKARTYSPTLGRFLQVDPVGYADGMNLYDYVGSDPVNSIDPTGTVAVADDIVVTGTLIKVAVPVVLKAIGGLGAAIGGLFGIFSGGPPKIQYKPKDPARTKQNTSPKGSQITCTGSAYVMQGNSRLIGNQGFPNTKVVNGSAAVIPRQFTGELTAGRTMRAIGRGASGTLTAADGRTQSFRLFTDAVAEAKLGTARKAQDIIMARDKGAVVFEVVGGIHFGAGAKYNISIPNTSYGCPTGIPK